MPALRLLALFFGSGACALIYQVVWMRALSLTLSVTVYAVATVLCAFMAGLGFGAALAGRMADRLARPLRVFGLVEIGIGLAGLLMPRLLFGLAPIEIWLTTHFGTTGLGFDAGRFLLAMAILLPPCTLMGMTLPLLTRAVVASEDHVGRAAGGLYAANTLGAVAGCVAAGFALIPSLGLQSTSAVAAGINFLIGGIAVVLGDRPSGAPRPAEGLTPPRPASAPLHPWLVAAAFGISGLTALGYEVLWTRALEQFTHNSTYAYTAMLATFLLGIGLGSALCARPADRTPRPLFWFGALELGIGLCVITALLVYTRLFWWIPEAASAVGGLGSWERVIALLFAVCGITILPSTLCFGATFPFVARAVVDSIETVGRRVALAYTVNTVGSILGALGVGFLLLPLLGLQGSFVALIALNVSLGGALAVFAAPTRLAPAAAAAAALGLVGSLLLLPSQLFQRSYAERYGNLLMYREQVTDTVMVTEDGQGLLIRYGDGRGTAGTGTFLENRAYAHLAMLPHPSPKRVLQICFGVGNSLASVARYPVDHIDQVELSPGVIDAAPFFRETNRNVLEDPRVNLAIQDGRNFLLTSRDRYDVILLEPPELHTAGVVNLYTKEFYEIAREHLAPGGLISMWINVFMTPVPETRMVLRTMAEVFPHVTVWHDLTAGSWILNGSVDPRPPDLAILTRWFSHPQVRADLATIPLSNPYEVLNLFVMADDEVRAWTRDVPVITDDHTRVDFRVPRSRAAFFGVSNHITNHYLVRQMNFEVDFAGLAKAYCEPKQPVWPHLVEAQASGLTAAETRARVEAELGRLPWDGCVGDAQAAGVPAPSS
jgi:predicted membrane-bound spermidine synthase